MWLYNLRSQATETELTLPGRVVAMTSCNDGGDFTLLCSTNHLIQFKQVQTGYQESKQVILDENVSMSNVTSLVKLDDGLFAIFNMKGQIRFASLHDQELVKFRTSIGNVNQAEDMLPLLQHSER